MAPSWTWPPPGIRRFRNPRNPLRLLLALGLGDLCPGPVPLLIAQGGEVRALRQPQAGQLRLRTTPGPEVTGSRLALGGTGHLRPEEIVEPNMGVAQCFWRARVAQALVFASIYLHLPRGHFGYMFLSHFIRGGGGGLSLGFVGNHHCRRAPPMNKQDISHLRYNPLITSFNTIFTGDL